MPEKAITKVGTTVTCTHCKRDMQIMQYKDESFPDSVSLCYSSEWHEWYINQKEN
jgi:hypothetical protein